MVHLNVNNKTWTWLALGSRRGELSRCNTCCSNISQGAWVVLVLPSLKYQEIESLHFGTLSNIVSEVGLQVVLNIVKVCIFNRDSVWTEDCYKLNFVSSNSYFEILTLSMWLYLHIRSLKKYLNWREIIRVKIQFFEYVLSRRD